MKATHAFHRFAPCVAAFALAAALPLTGQAETYWRWTSNGSAAEPTWTEVESAAFTPPAFTGTTPEDNVVEFVQDCTYGQANYYTLTSPMTMRSKPGVGVRTVKSAYKRRGSCIYVENKSTPIALVVSNLTVHGGCEWKTDTITDTTVLNADTPGSGFCWLAYGATFELGDGGTLRNFRPNCNYNKGVIDVDDYRGSKIYLKPGSLITDCRAEGGAIVSLGNFDQTKFYMTGGEISKCYVTKMWEIVGIVATYNYRANAMYFRGGKIINNVVASAAAVNTGTFYFSGDMVIKDNTCSGNPANVLPANNARVILEGDLTADAAIGISYPETPTAGAQFGTASAAGFSGANRFFADADPYGLEGQVSDAQKLVWKVPVLEDIVLTASDVCTDADGAAHTIPLTVTTPASGATVLWSTSKNGTFTAEKPSFTEPGVYAVWYRVSASGYRVHEGGKMVVLNDPAAETVGYRLKNDGGAWLDCRKTDYTTPPFTGRTPESNVVEFMSNCTTEDTTAYGQSCTLRSGAGAVRTLFTRFPQNTYAALQSDLVVSNLVVDGGAKFKYRDDVTRTEYEEGGIFYRVLFDVQIGASLTLGAGAVVTNYYPGDSFGVIKVQTSCTMLEGARIVDCRGRTSVVCLVGGAQSSFTMLGGEITHCYNSVGKVGYAAWGIVGDSQFYNYFGRFALRGGRIHGNVVEADAAVTVSRSETGSSLSVSGSTYVYGNFKSDGTKANVYLVDANRLTMDGDLTGSAQLGVSCASGAAQGAAFGKATDAWEGASAFRCDTAKLFGGIKDGNLVWKQSGFSVIVK